VPHAARRITAGETRGPDVIGGNADTSGRTQSVWQTASCDRGARTVYGIEGSLYLSRHAWAAEARGLLTFF